MAEPARKLDNDNNERLSPSDFSIIPGGNRDKYKAKQNQFHVVRPNISNINDVRRQESNPQELNNSSAIDQEKKELDTNNESIGSWNTSVVGKPSIKQIKGTLKGIKGKGPLLSLIVILFFLLGTLFTIGPSLLLVNFKEVLVNKLDYQLTSMELRTNKILKLKVNSTTTGVCSGVISIKCKYATLSDKQIEKFKKAGIDIEVDEKTTITGRSKPTKFIYNEKEISPSDFMKTYLNDPNFRTAVKKVYNPKYMGFSDSVWTKIKSRFKISKEKVEIEGDTEEERLKDIQKDTKYGTNDSGEINNAVKNSSNPDEVNEIAKGAEEVSSSGEKSSSAFVQAAKGTLSKVSSVIGITGLADQSCSVYNAAQGVAYAAKAVRAVQLVRYAMIPLNVADQIKAGVADQKDTTYWGDILTQKDSDGATATDSSGYKYVAYSDITEMPTSASQYLTGGGLTGSLSGFVSELDKKSGGSAKKVCSFTASVPYQIGSSAIGVVAIVLSGGTLGVVDVAKIVAQGAIQGALGYLPNLLQDIVAGVVIDSNTVGGQSGNAIVSGAGQLMSSLAQVGGNSPLTPDQAVAYNDLSNQVAKTYADEDRVTYSPLDATNKNTFLGSIAYGITPYFAKISSFSSLFTSISSLTSKTFASIFLPSTRAESASDYETCQDYDYRSLNLATDPFCNVVYGIPPEDLDIDPNNVVDYLLSKGDIDETGKTVSGSTYEHFQKTCINRTSPLGYDDEGDDGSECLYSKSQDNKYFYLYTIDQRISDGMDSGN